MGNFQLKSRHSDIAAAWLFILPSVIGTFVFIVIPVIFSFFLGFVKWDLLNEIEFAGFSNYREIFNDGVFIQTLINTFTYAISVSVLGVIVPLVLAGILNNKIKGAELYKTAYFIPYITPMIAAALVWQWIFDPNMGILNQILHLHINWLYDKAYAMPALIAVSVWKLTGYNMILFLSGFASINQDILSAAKIDGAGEWSTFINVTIPLLSPTIFFVMVITTISSFQVFDLIYMMTQGGPENSTMVLVYSIYKYAFEYFEVGKASAVAYILFFIIFFLVLFQCKFRKKIIYNEP